jgi:F0F1-type ATP synthase assembly protein I
MSYAGQFAPDRIGRVVMLQGLLAGTAAVIAWWLQGGAGAAAAAYGGGTAVANTAILAWQIRRGKGKARSDAYRQLREIYFSGAQRLAALIVLLTVGFGILKLAPLALLAGFVAGQVGLLFSGLLSGKT